jgi:hypothetical protein
MLLFRETIQHYRAVKQDHDWHERSGHRIAAAYRSTIRIEYAETEQNPKDDRRRGQDRALARDQRASKPLGRRCQIHAFPGAPIRATDTSTRNATAKSFFEAAGQAHRGLACRFGCDIPHVSVVHKRRLPDFRLHMSVACPVRFLRRD